MHVTIYLPQMVILKQDTNYLLLLQALLSAHDQVAVKSFIPNLPEIAHEVDEDDEASVKIVRLVKGTTEPLVSRPTPQEYIFCG